MIKKYLAVGVAAFLLVGGLPFLAGGEPELTQEELNELILEHVEQIAELEEQAKGLFTENSDLKAEIEAQAEAIGELEAGLQVLQTTVAAIGSGGVGGGNDPPEPGGDPQGSIPDHYEINGQTHCPHCGVKYLDLVYNGAKGCDKCPWP